MSKIISNINLSISKIINPVVISTTVNICTDLAGVGITLANMVRKNVPRRVVNVGIRLFLVVNGVPFPFPFPPAPAAAAAAAIDRADPDPDPDMCIGVKLGSSTAVVVDDDDGDDALYGTSDARNI